MNAITTTIGGAATLPKAKMSAALRTAIKLRVEQGLTITQAVGEAGMSEAGWHKAMKRPDVQAYLEAVELRYIQSVEAQKARHRARAFEVAAHLMEHAKSESVKMRAVEFFAGEPKSGPSLSVQINAGGAYEYAKPGQQIVEIRAQTDKQSDGEPS